MEETVIDDPERRVMIHKTTTSFGLVVVMVMVKELPEDQVPPVFPSIANVPELGLGCAV